MAEARQSDVLRSSERSAGASPQAIRAHYDVGNEFFRLWLDENLIYSCAIWDGENDTLQSAQDRKIEYHIRTARAMGQESVLEIGCGWGACLRKLTQEHGVKRAVGLTLSKAQADWINAQKWRGVEARVESYRDHQPSKKYDAIISIAATAHFIRPEHSVKERVEIFRDFFTRCHDWLAPGGYLSMESIVYGIGAYIPHSPLSGVFPESDMPRLGELATAFDRLFEPDQIVNHRMHYPRTLACWLENLERNKEQAIAVAGQDVFQRYSRYLSAGIKGHEAGVFLLLRYALKSLDGAL